MLVIDAGGGGGSHDPVIISSSNEGSTSDTSVIIGSYSGFQAKIVGTHAALVTKVGPIFRPYDPLITSLLAMEF